MNKKRQEPKQSKQSKQEREHQLMIQKKLDTIALRKVSRGIPQDLTPPPQNIKDKE